MAEFGSIFAALYIAHMVGDHWAQIDCQAAGKAAKTWRGRLICAGHCATHVVVSAAFLGGLALVFNWSPHWGLVGLGLIVIGVTHYFADRRDPLAWLARITKHKAFVELGKPREGHDDNPSLGTGMYALDQSFHIWWLGVAALIMAL